MKKYVGILAAVIVILFTVIIAVSRQWKPDSTISNLSKPGTIVAPAPPSEKTLSFFVDTVTYIVQTNVEDYEKLGLGGGVDGFVMIKAFPGLLPSDFYNVGAIGGGYSVLNGELSYTGNMASNSAVLTKEGMRTLLQNCSKRLRVSADTKEGIRQIITLLRQVKRTS
jgi:hypothetical protein